MTASSSMRSSNHHHHRNDAAVLSYSVEIAVTPASAAAASSSASSSTPSSCSSLDALRREWQSYLETTVTTAAAATVAATAATSAAGEGGDAATTSGAEDRAREDQEEERRRRRSRIDEAIRDAPLALSKSYAGHHAIQVEGFGVGRSRRRPNRQGGEEEAAAFGIRVYCYVPSTEEPAIEELQPIEGGGNDDGDGGEWTAGCDSLVLPHANLQGLWESLVYEEEENTESSSSTAEGTGNAQQTLLDFARSALLFADLDVSSNLVHCNRLVLLHGPPGTGKTSLCRALAQKLAIRFSHRFRSSTLLEIHSHSLFSKWFSTSGKLVRRLFELVRDMVHDDPDCLVVVLMDEVESLAASRAGGGGGGTNEPSDAVRAVNSLLTGIDTLRNYPNVLVLATTNITNAIDDALVDRADLKLHIGLPCCEARYRILESGLGELQRVGIVERSQELIETPTTINKMLRELAERSEGLSGRSLRRLPLQAHARLSGRGRTTGIGVVEYLNAMTGTIDTEVRNALRVSSSTMAAAALSTNTAPSNGNLPTPMSSSSAEDEGLRCYGMEVVDSSST